MRFALYLLIIAAIVGFFIMSMYTRTVTEEFFDIIWLKGIVFALILSCFILTNCKGLKIRSAILDMSDVNFFFVSPVKPQNILLYGIVRMMGMSFFAGIFVLFQSNALGQWFGVYFSDILIFFAGTIVAVSLMQIMSLIIYSLTNGKPKRKIAVKIIAFTLFTPMIVCAITEFLGADGDIMRTLEALLRSPVTSWTPVVGWTAEGVFAFITGDIAMGLLFFGVIVVFGALLILYILKSNPDYYEDALVATETMFEKKRAIAEGQVNLEALSDKKVTVAKTGVNGAGSSAFFHRHLRELFRVNRFGLETVSVWIILISIGIAIITRFYTNEDSTDGSGFGILMLLQGLMWIKIFTIGMGRGLKEIYAHYIYMIPESSFSKLVWSNLETVFKSFAEAVLVFVSVGIILQVQPPLWLACIAVYALFSLLLIGINYLLLRLAGIGMNVGIMMLFYILAVILIMLPGAIPALIVGNTVESWGVLIGLVILAAWEVIAALLCFALSSGILHRCDISSVNMWNKRA
jgi:hypothetical protein